MISSEFILVVIAIIVLFIGVLLLFASRHGLRDDDYDDDFNQNNHD
jgi:nitrogen fixation-related uncharacterized protein